MVTSERRRIVVTINGRIVLLRQRLGLSQRAFAERICRSTAYINRIENGKAELTEGVIQSISAAFGVPISWLEKGEGPLIVESVGDRIRRARKTRDYTQEELAEEIGVSRNSVGMIERGTFRPSEEVIDSLCSRLWLDRNWLLTGQGKMERTELTPFYTILRQDPAVRAHILSYINHLNRPYRNLQEEHEEAETEDCWVTAYMVNDVEQARLFCEKNNIEYKEEPDGKIKVKKERDVDYERAIALRTRLRKMGLSQMCDHEFIWRDRDGNTIITYSPYDVEDVKQVWIEKAENNFYGHGTTTYLIRC